MRVTWQIGTLQGNLKINVLDKPFKSIRVLGLDGRLKSKKEIEGLNKEMQAKKEAEMVQKIIEKVKAECKAQGEDVDRRGYTKHYAATS